MTNRNSIPADPNGAWYTSGIRLGTPALTTLGFGPDRDGPKSPTSLIDTLSATTPSGRSKAHYTVDATIADTGRRRSAELLARFPLYPQIQL